VTILFDGLFAFQRKITEMIAKMDGAARESVSKAAHLVEAKAKANFHGRHSLRQPHFDAGATRLGATPNIVTGALMNSIHVEGPTRLGIGSYQAKVGPSTVYARAIELGLWQNPSVKYPYFGPGFDDAKPEMRTIYRDAWAGVLA
jgi:hypothetical protein